MGNIRYLDDVVCSLGSHFHELPDIPPIYVGMNILLYTYMQVHYQIIICSKSVILTRDMVWTHLCTEASLYVYVVKYKISW